MATLEYIAAGGNRHSSAADWASALLAFGAGNNIALWNPEDESERGIESLLAGHTDSVNAVKIVERGDRHLIISGSSDKTILLWTAANDVSNSFEETQCLTEHNESINALAILPDIGIFVSGSADATVKVWRLENTTAKLIQSISLKPRYLPLALALTALPNGDIVLAVAGTSSVIQLYVSSQPCANFELQASLSGHEGWIRSLDFTKEANSSDSDILLASASQDKYIRLWRFHEGQKETTTSAQIADEMTAPIEKKSLANKTHEVGKSGSKHSVTFEALLIGHEDWIYTARWKSGESTEKGPILLSASADNSLSIWHADAASGLWVCNSRLGEISSLKGSTSATGSTGGFWIGLWQPEGLSVVSLGRSGSWRRWAYDQGSDMWLQKVGISGHVGEVQGLAWSPSGNYLLSTASDQTTRLLAEWKKKGTTSWHELSRPQIHGYDLNCIDTVTDNQFISGADEKLLRVFNKPKAVDEIVLKLAGKTTSPSSDLPDTANIPVLGLSNKAMTGAEEDEEPNGLDNGHTNGHTEPQEPSTAATNKTPFDVEHPTFEDHLARHTLWPEHEKLYGHGYEICAVATSNDRSLVATACKASSIDHAVIRLYDTKEWREVKPPLTAHSLTATSLGFSPDDSYLLSVGRDRQWAIFKRAADDLKSYSLFTSNPKGHSRMILDCSWAPVTCNYTFATAGRDKSIKIWQFADGKADCVATIATAAPVTTVAFDPVIGQDTLRIAFGDDTGRIGLALLDAATLKVLQRNDIDARLTHCKTVTALRWRPVGNTDDASSTSSKAQLASASDDMSVRIYDI
ncbi:Elongator complex protein 2 [Fulvia fulva]|uniref:Elongator complex protein 2 n=1 Tax=Passalora fulva TaxID=5499 RepID=A0A9Q8L9H4_PASFU|nr:Elongator complex protein 2 [Fulvia fulva]KAK4632063.1 Elongator complex protein 2 [Fulvia fulva]KAK4634001.1 Elongator complex protein 2 [Fulvia fulva]UJO13312.1 Elongator complex protein 2 [Fulvia fulva]WPV10950.1 Elongator complex protein 2 [Fulvia fulva]WPV25554.1 Elongator complex protein 2 [Fulvia fulva]